MGHICLLQACQTIHRWILLQYFYRAFVPYRGYLVEFPMSGCPQSLLPHSGPIRLLLCSCAQPRRTSTGTLCSELHPCAPLEYTHTLAQLLIILFQAKASLFLQQPSLYHHVPLWVSWCLSISQVKSAPIPHALFRRKKFLRTLLFFSFLSSLLKVLR